MIIVNRNYRRNKTSQSEKQQNARRKRKVQIVAEDIRSNYNQSNGNGRNSKKEQLEKKKGNYSKPNSAAEG